MHPPCCRGPGCQPWLCQAPRHTAAQAALQSRSRLQQHRARAGTGVSPHAPPTPAQSLEPLAAAPAPVGPTSAPCPRGQAALGSRSRRGSTWQLPAEPAWGRQLGTSFVYSARRNWGRVPRAGDSCHESRDTWCRHRQSRNMGQPRHRQRGAAGAGASPGTTGPSTHLPAQSPGAGTPGTGSAGARWGRQRGPGAQPGR